MKSFGIFASIIGFIVDAVTILGWLLVPDAFVLHNIKIPVINAPFPLETLTLLVLIYTFILFLLLRYSSETYYNENGEQIFPVEVMRKKAVYTIVSAATLPFFLIWFGAFHNLDLLWIVGLSFLSVDLYCAIVFSTIDVRYSFLTGLLLSPLAAAWIHEQFIYNWLKSFSIGFLLGNSGILFILAFFLVGFIVISIFELFGKLISMMKTLRQQ